MSNSAENQSSGTTQRGTRRMFTFNSNGPQAVFFMPFLNAILPMRTNAQGQVQEAQVQPQPQQAQQQAAPVFGPEPPPRSEQPQQGPNVNTSHVRGIPFRIHFTVTSMPDNGSNRRMSPLEAMMLHMAQAMSQATEQPTGPPPASEEQLKNLEIFKYGESEGATRDEKCAICLSDYEAGDALAKIPCGHSYHDECVSKWLKMHNSCPSCRTPLPGGESEEPEPSPPEPEPEQEQESEVRSDGEQQQQRRPTTMGGETAPGQQQGIPFAEFGTMFHMLDRFFLEMMNQADANGEQRREQAEASRRRSAPEEDVNNGGHARPSTPQRRRRSVSDNVGSLSDLSNLSVRTLKTLLDNMNIDYSHCIEKQELVRLLQSELGATPSFESSQSQARQQDLAETASSQTQVSESEESASSIIAEQDREYAESLARDQARREQEQEQTTRAESSAGWNNDIADQQPKQLTREELARARLAYFNQQRSTSGSTIATTV